MLYIYNMKRKRNESETSEAGRRGARWHRVTFTLDFLAEKNNDLCLVSFITFLYDNLSNGLNNLFLLRNLIILTSFLVSINHILSKTLLDCSVSP